MGCDDVHNPANGQPSYCIAPTAAHTELLINGCDNTASFASIFHKMHGQNQKIHCFIPTDNDPKHTYPEFKAIMDASTTSCIPNSNCVLGAAKVAGDCLAACGTLTQAITTPKFGTGTCSTPGTYACQAGDGACPLNTNCVLGPTKVAANCLVACGTLTQAITTAAAGSGTCGTPGTYACQPGDGACPMPPKTDCVLGPAKVAADCLAACGTLTQAITTAKIGAGTCSPGTYACQPEDGACPKEETLSAASSSSIPLVLLCTVLVASLSPSA